MNRRSRWYRFASLLLAALFAVSGPAYALPSGHDVVHGDADIRVVDDHHMTVDQASDQLIVNWDEFGIGAHEAVTFAQPSTSSVALNRVVGDNLSEIHG